NVSLDYNASSATGATGIANFSSLLSGSYTVTEQMQPGWAATGPTTQTATILPGSATTITFTNKLVYPSQLHVLKYNDLDGNGSHDPGEPLLSEWPFSISGPSGMQSG